jgi:hypothetical protein
VRRTFKQILAEYGTTALVVYLVIFTLVLLGVWLGIRLGWRPESTAGNVGTFTLAYLVTKATQPLRIGATLVLTPFVARIWERVTGRRPAEGPGPGTRDPSDHASV